MAGNELHHIDVDGTRYWFGEPPPEPAPEPAPAELLQTYDEYICYGESRWLLDRSGAARMVRTDRAQYNATLLLGTQVAGRWKRTPRAGSVHIDVLPLRPLSPAERTAVRAAAGRHARFLGLAEATVAIPE